MSIQTSKIKLSAVEKHFTSARGERQVAVSPLDLEIQSGEFVCLVGPSGCGKTTLINLMAGFEQPSAGSVTIDGRPVSGPDPDHIMIFQDYGLYPWRTVLGNVLFGLQAKGIPAGEARDRALATLELVGLRHAIDKHPHELSGGMKQRVAIARALAVEPSVLFMDEPFAALDAFTRYHLQDELLRLWQETRPTVVFVTHDLDEAIALGQRIVLMAPNPGRIQRVLEVSLPHPRERTRDDFAFFRRELFTEFHLVHQMALQEAEYSI
ncbi:putative ABC transporter ATP-binding protein [Geobacter sp. OR-1]|uniref:ABC transporter ATP-binding protein n=1 Tax=Geobacter sp. OR-1 TaxID=1266765 RepID=UPI000544241B|nr:ABC transporter ATP-binding protein [Geobacter sp. OR-1]GAM10238.1 putative ABC transporter ATP-binding protein [Geobacter sp. OR-1]